MAEDEGGEVRGSQRKLGGEREVRLSAREQLFIRTSLEGFALIAGMILPSEKKETVFKVLFPLLLFITYERSASLCA